MRDEEFVRGEAPMTKREIRAVSVERLELREDSVLFDIGAGTGSVAVEASYRLLKGRVYAIERKREAIRLIRENIGKFRRGNITVVEGTAPEALEGLECPTHAFIGGSSGNMREIIELLLKINPGIRIVINVIALETLSQVVNLTGERGLLADIVSIQVGRAEKVGPYHLMKGQNPVYVITLGGEEHHYDKP